MRTIPGTPTVAGIGQMFSVTVTDSLANTTTSPVRLDIYDPIPGTINTQQS